MVTLSRMVVQFNIAHLLKMTPFQALYGYEPPNWKELVMKETNVPEVRNQLEKSQKMIELLKDNLYTIQNCVRQQADQCITKREFEVGDLVFVRLQPYKHISLKNGGKNKLSPKFNWKFWREFFKQVGTSLNMSSTYHLKQMVRLKS